MGVIVLHLQTHRVWTLFNILGIREFGHICEQCGAIQWPNVPATGNLHNANNYDYLSLSLSLSSLSLSLYLYLPALVQWDSSAVYAVQTATWPEVHPRGTNTCTARRDSKLRGQENWLVTDLAWGGEGGWVLINELRLTFKCSSQLANCLHVAGASLLHTPGSRPLNNELAMLSSTWSMPISPAMACERWGG